MRSNSLLSLSSEAYSSSEKYSAAWITSSHIVSSILADYQSEEAFQQSAESYGAKIPTQKYL